MSGKAPSFGYERASDGRGLVPCQAEQGLLELILSWRRSGLTCRQISALLKHGERAVNPRTGRAMTAAEVRSALASARALARRAAPPAA